jgi:glycosyltransferase involved in cell wall biosynthesis
MEQLYKKVHVGILPSYREGLPKSLLEAASSGKPIITTDVPGCNEIVKNEFNGLIVPPKNSNELMKAMKKLILNKKLRISMGKKGRELIKKNFSNSKATKDIVNLYQNNS